MCKRFFLLSAIICVMSLSFTVLIACRSSNSSNPNVGKIGGLSGGQFTTHFNRGVLYLPGGENQTTRLISSRSELTKWQASKAFTEYDDEFFEAHQLVFISFWGSILDYETYRISYTGNTLNIEFRTTTRPMGNVDLGAAHIAIVEITRISENLDVVFSHRLR